MGTFTKAPNPDVYQVVDEVPLYEFERIDLRLEVWEHEGNQVWVLVFADDEVYTNIPISDTDAAQLIRWLGGEP